MSGTQSYTFEKEYQKMLEDGSMLMGKMLGDQDAAAKELEEYHIKCRKF